jgi:isopenicillin-N N-acyltransferase-like protein
MPNIRLLEVSGTPFEMGQQHGQAHRAAIQELAEDRLHLAGSKSWTGQELSRAEILALGAACLPYHEAYSPTLLEELHGISQATGVGLTELLILNGFTDFIDTVAARAAQPVPAPPGADNCTAFIISPDAAAAGQGFYGQTWDMHDTATPYMILLQGKPATGLRFLTFTITGCVGMIGLNEAGLAVGINNLVAGDGRPGLTWPFVVRKILAQNNLEEALACITEAPLAGGHNYLLADATGRGYNVEAMATRCHVEEVTSGSFVHTNHCLIAQNVAVERKRLPQSQASSETRLSRGQELLSQGRITLDDLLALTRDHQAINGICVHPEAPFFLRSCGAALMRPATGEMWAVWGNPCENEYERFVV